MPAYILGIVYIELWLIKKLSKILKNAETIHMHFPVQILAENTYLTSYFNDKIKNSKWGMSLFSVYWFMIDELQ